ncbi:hypothetical protein Tco_0608291 [Tanacetum coccineum]
MLGTTMTEDSTSGGFSISPCRRPSYFLGNARNKQLWLYLLQKQNMLHCCKLLCIMFFGSKSYSLIGFNFMHTENPISTMRAPFAIVKNPVIITDQRTKHIQDSSITSFEECYEQRLINWSRFVQMFLNSKVRGGRQKPQQEEQRTIPHSRAARSARVGSKAPNQSAAHVSHVLEASLKGTASFQGTATFLKGLEIQRTCYFPREVRRLKKQTLSQAKLLLKLKAKLKKLSKFVQPVVKHHAFWVESQHLKKQKRRRKKQKRRRKKQKKKVSSVKLGRNKEEGTLSEEHYVQDDYTADPFFEDIVDKDAAVTPDLERKSDETEEINIEEKKASDVKSGDTEELDLEAVQSTARQSTITPRTLNFNDEAGPSSPIRPTQNIEPEEQFKVDEVLADISRPRGLSIPGPIQSQPQPQQPSQATDPKDKGKGILVEEPKKKKLTLQQIRALETTNDEEVARKIQAEWDAEEERKRLEELKKAKPKTTLRKPTSLAQERNQMMNFLKGQGYKNLQKLKYPQMKELYDKVQESIKDSFKDFIPMDSEKEREMLKEREAKRLLRKRKATISEEQPSKKLKLRTETIDELRNYLRIVDFEKNAQDRESLEGISMITELQVIDSPDGEYLIIHRANNHFRAFDTLWEILHILDRQDLYHLYRVVQDYYELLQTVLVWYFYDLTTVKHPTLGDEPVKQ